MKIPRTATVVIAVLTAAAFLIEGLLAPNVPASLTMGFIPARWSGGAAPWAAVPAFLTPLSSSLVHADLLHLGFNLLMLVWCGSAVERVLGRGALVTLYVAGAYAAAVAQWAVDPQSIIPVIGASGAISAIIGAFALSFGQQKRLVSSPRLNRTLNALWLLAAWVVLQIMTGLLAGVQGFLLATPAHIGGFIAGLLLQRPLLLWRYRSA